MNILARVMLMIAIFASIATPLPVSAEVDPRCAKRFAKGGAIPGAAACFTEAITSAAGLGDYSCTADDGTIAREFCGELKQCPTGFLPDYDTGECKTVTGGEDDDTTDDDGTKRCKYGLPDFVTGQCPEKPVLEKYDEGTGGDEGKCSDPKDPIRNLPGPVVFATQGVQFVDNVIVSNAGTISSGIAATNLVQAVRDSQTSGDTSAVFENIYDIVLPILPGDNTISNAFQNFSRFYDSLNGGCN